MIKFIFSIFKKVNCLGKQRSYLWKEVRKNHLKNFPECAVCGRKKNIVPHHIIPVSVDPSLELDPNNLITLCEGPSFNCHLFFGHLRNWSSHNPDVKKHAKEWNKIINSSID